MNGEFLARMEDVLHLYSLPYEADAPVVCFDERPCVLHGEVVEPLRMRPGKPRREAYEYERRGTCCLLVAVEPLTGFRMVEVSERRTAADYTRFMERLAAHYGEAKRIHLVQDNLNTHTATRTRQHAHGGLVLQAPPGGGGVRAGAALRAALHAEEGTSRRRRGVG